MSEKSLVEQCREYELGQQRMLAKAQIAGRIVAMRPYDGQIVEWALQLAEEILKGCEVETHEQG